MQHCMSKDTAFNEETTPRKIFHGSDSQCLPPGDPKVVCAKQGSPITAKSFIKFDFSMAVAPRLKPSRACPEISHVKLRVSYIQTVSQWFYPLIFTVIPGLIMFGKFEWSNT